MDDIFEVLEKEFEILPPRSGKQGSFGIVYFVRHKELKYTRAIKTLRVNNDDMSDEIKEHLKRIFTEECEKLMRLGNGRNPNIIKIHKCRVDNDPYYIEMDYVKGESIGSYAKNNFLTIEEVYHFIKNIAGALAYCHCYKDEEGHDRGVVHNDLHSGNIIRRAEDGEYILLDFGLAIDNGRIIRSSMRRTGWCEFMSPERCDLDQHPSTSEFRKADTAWDVYSLGCLIFLALTGRAPFSIEYDGLIDDQVQNKHLEVDNEQPWENIKKYRESHFKKIYPNKEFQDSQQCPVWLIKMIEKCMSGKADKRYPNAKVFWDIFEKTYNEKIVSLEFYDKSVEEIEKLRKDIADLQECNKQLLIEKGKIVYKMPIKRNWMITFSILIALTTLCVPYFGKDANETIAPASIVLSILAALMLIGVTIYDTIVTNSQKAPQK